MTSRSAGKQMIAAVDARGEGNKPSLKQAPAWASPGYLLPAIEHIAKFQEDKDQKRRVVIHAHLALQEQIINKDVPLLQAVLPVEFVPCSSRARATTSPSAGPSVHGIDRRRCSTSQGVQRLEQILDWTKDRRRFARSLPQLESPAVGTGPIRQRNRALSRRTTSASIVRTSADRTRTSSWSITRCSSLTCAAGSRLRRASAYDAVILDEAHTIEDVASSASASPRRVISGLPHQPSLYRPPTERPARFIAG